MINTREYLQETYQAKSAGRLYPAVFTGKRGRKTLPSRRLAIELNAEAASMNDLVYFMLVEGVLKYIGYTATSLQSRVNNYNTGRYNSSSGTNKKVFKLILEGDLQVELLYVKVGTIKQFGLPVSLARSLEYTLIQEHNPEWNKRIR